MENTRIFVQRDTFVFRELHDWLSRSSSDGAVVTFVGKVRQQSRGETISALILEHYSGMTEAYLQILVHSVRERWKVGRICVIHRVGKLAPNDDIVFVGVSSEHRKNAFDATEYIMDMMKTRAPFWKKEVFSEDEKWVEASIADYQRASRWT